MLPSFIYGTSFAPYSYYKYVFDAVQFCIKSRKPFPNIEKDSKNILFYVEVRN